MATLLQLDIPISSLTCDTCKIGDISTHKEDFTPYVLLNIDVPQIGTTDMLTVPIDVRKIEWEKETDGRYFANATMAVVCPCCDTPRDLQYHLDAPVIFLSSIGYCHDCKQKLLLSNEHIDYFYDENEQSFITIKGTLTCPHCAKNETANLQLSAPNPSTLLQTRQITINGNVSGSTIIIGNENRINSGELGTLIQELTLTVEKMVKSLPKVEAERVSRDLETLISESKSETPNRKWWEVSVDGLSKAAKNLGEIGKPVLEILAKIAPILLSMSK